MTDEPSGAGPRAAVPIRVAIDVSEPGHAALIRAAIARAPDLMAAEIGTGVPAEVVVTDRHDPTTGSWLEIHVGEAEPGAGWPAAALVPPEIDPATLVHVIMTARAGFVVRPAGVADQPPSWAGLGDPLEPMPESDQPVDVALTGREREVLALLLEGASNKAVARRLGIAPRTVKFHVASLIDKLGGQSRLDVVAIALRRGLLML